MYILCSILFHKRSLSIKKFISNVHFSMYVIDTVKEMKRFEKTGGVLLQNQYLKLFSGGRASFVGDALHFTKY